MLKFFTVLLLFIFALPLSSFANSVETIALLERQGENNTSLLVGATEAQIKKYLPDGKVRSQILAYLVRTGGREILFDTGLRDGHIVSELEKNGVKPDSINTILITHLHPDHFGGLVDSEGKAAFRNAKIYVSRIEYNYWVNDLKNDAVIYALNLYRDNINLFEFETEIFEGIKALDASGHTPGHTVFDVMGEILIAGDFMHFSEIQMPLPDISVRYDVDPMKAAETRKKILSYAGEKNIPVAGMHLTWPGIWHVRKSGAGWEKY